MVLIKRLQSVEFIWIFITHFIHWRREEGLSVAVCKELAGNPLSETQGPAAPVLWDYFISGTKSEKYE